MTRPGTAARGPGAARRGNGGPAVGGRGGGGAAFRGQSGARALAPPVNRIVI